MKNIKLALSALAFMALVGCESTGGSYWDKRSAAIAQLPADQQGMARIDMMRDQHAEEAARWQAAGAALQQIGRDVQDRAAQQQTNSYNAMQQSINNLSGRN